MDKENYLVAVASSDGIVVNSHFGRAGTFYIYEAKEDGNLEVLEKRVVSPVCNGGNHDEERLKENLKKLSDCSCLLVSRIGNSAAAMAEEYGLEAYEIPGMIEESIQQLTKYKKINRLFQ